MRQNSTDWRWKAIPGSAHEAYPQFPNQLIPQSSLIFHAHQIPIKHTNPPPDSAPNMQLPLLLLALVGLASAQFGGFFDQMFGGPGGGGGGSSGGGSHGHPREPQNVPSDPNMYRKNYDASYCSNYLCPDTLGSSPSSFWSLVSSIVRRDCCRILPTPKR